VSPVIGVILMVAITVILAAVIGTFVLGLGNSLEQAPQAQLNAEADSGGNLSISHNGGDPIAAGDIRVTVENESDDFTNSTFSISDGEFSVGDSFKIDSENISTNGDTQVQVIHVPSDSIILDTEVTFP